MDTWTGGTSPYDGAAEGIDSPGEYKLASSLAPACCGPHLSAPRPGPCGSGFCVSAPQPFSSPILAISPLWARPLQSLYCQPGTNGIINFSAHRQRSVFKPIKRKLLSAAANHWSGKRYTDRRVTNGGCEGKDCISRPHPSCVAPALSPTAGCTTDGAHVCVMRWNMIWYETSKTLSDSLILQLQLAKLWRRPKGWQLLLLANVS